MEGDRASRLLQDRFRSTVLRLQHSPVLLQQLGLPGQLSPSWRHPGYLLHITCPPGWVDICYQPDKSQVELRHWEPVLTLLAAAVSEAWRVVTTAAQWEEGQRGPASAPPPRLVGEKREEEREERRRGPASMALVESRRVIPSAVARAGRKRAAEQLDSSGGASPALTSLWSKRKPFEEGGPAPGVPDPTSSSAKGIQRMHRLGLGNRPAAAAGQAGTAHPSGVSGGAPAAARDRETDAGAGPAAVAALMASWRQRQVHQPLLPGGPAVLTLQELVDRTALPLLPVELTQADLAAAQPLPHQVADRRFLACLSGPRLLVLVDQHAADERVRLEELTRQLLAGKGDMQRGFALALRAPQPLLLCPAEVTRLDTYGPALKSWGWAWTEGPEPDALLLTHCPCIFGSPLGPADLRLTLAELAEASGLVPLPSPITRLLASKACRSALMFGDQLLPNEARALLLALAGTKRCFSCAHGRPTMAPLVDLVLLREVVRSSQHTQGTNKPRSAAAVKAKLQLALQLANRDATRQGS